MRVNNLKPLRSAHRGKKHRTLLLAGLSVLAAAAALLPVTLHLRADAVSANRAAKHYVTAEHEVRTEELAYHAAAAEEPAARVFEQVPVLNFRVSELSPTVMTEMDYVDWWYCQWEDARYLFLPATADRSRLKLDFKASGTLTLNGKTVTSGQMTDIFTADELQVRVGTVDCGTLYVMQSNLPVMYMTTATGGLDKLNKASRLTDYYETGSLLCLNADGSTDYSGEMEKLTSHGNSSWDYAYLYNMDTQEGQNPLTTSTDRKGPYNLKLPEKAKLYGMGKAKKWVLMGNKLDYSMLRNRVASDIAEEIGLEFGMDYAYADLYCDGSYRGTYQIYERVQVQKHRVNITDLEEATEALNDKALDEYTEIGVGGAIKGLTPGSYRYFDIPNNPADITGGYLIQFQLANRYTSNVSDRSGFVTSHGQPVQLVSPENASKAQVLYIRNFVQELEDALYSETGYNSKGKCYSDYLDIDSLALGYLLLELSANADGQWTSFFLWKDSDAAGDGKLHYGPVWDYDFGFLNYYRSVKDATGQWFNAKGDPMTFSTWDTNNLYIMHQPVHGYYEVNADGSQMNPGAATLGWLGQFYRHEEQRIAELYFERVAPVAEKYSDPTQPGGARVTQMGEEMLDAGNMNAARWHMFGYKPFKALGPDHGDSFTECVEFVRNYIANRDKGLQGIWLGAAEQALAEKIPALLDAVPLARYDSDGVTALNAAVEAGRAAVTAAADYAAAQEAFAGVQHAIDAVPMKELPGDFNNDLKVDIYDAQSLLMRYAMELAELDTDALDATRRRNGDVDRNGRLDAVDAMHILRCVNLRLIGCDYDFSTGKAVQRE